MSEQEAQAEARAWARDVLGIADDEPNAATGSDIADSFHMLTEAYIAGASRVPVVAPSDTDREALVRAVYQGLGGLVGSYVPYHYAERVVDILKPLLSRSQPVQVEVTTAAELDALNLDAVVVDRAGVPRTKRAGNSHMPGGWTHGGKSPLTSTELADGNPMTVVYAGRDLLSRPAALGGGDHE